METPHMFSSSGRKAINSRLTGGGTPRTVQTPRTGNGQQNKTPKTKATPGTAGGSGRQPGETFIMAITENKRREVGLAFLSVKRATITISQFKDTGRYGCLGSFLDTFPPSEIVLPVTLENGGLHSILLDSDYNFVKFTKRQQFNDNKGREMLRHIATAESSSVELQVKESYLALAAFHALLKYTQFGEAFTYATKSCRVEYRCPNAYLQLDPITISNLELVRNLRSGTAKQSLFGVLNHCHTSMGQRLLRTTIIQPLSSMTQLPTIIQRQELIDVLIHSEDAFFELSERLPNFPDLELMVATTLSTVPKQGWLTVEGCQTLTKKILSLKQSLYSVEGLLSALDKANGDCALLRSFKATLSNPRIAQIIENISQVLDDDLRTAGAVPAKGNHQMMMQLQRCFAVRPGVESLLDISRQALSDVMDDIYEQAQLLSEQYHLGSLKVTWSAKRGFHLSVKSDPASLPAIFIQTHQQSGNTLCTTEDIASLNSRHMTAVQEIYLLTGRVLEDMIVTLRNDIGVLLSIADVVSLLDMLFSFAQLVTLSDKYVRPEFKLNGPLAIREGIHPMSTLYCQEIDGQSFVPNNTFLGNPCRCCLLTGPNMSGKSLYLRQVALITILAHTGSFVPASYACIPCTDRVFTRVGTGDDLQTNQSTFYMEMKEMAHIVQNATSTSLVIIDELGRGTSNHDGVGIAWACCEYLIGCKSLTLFATHYRELLQLPSIYPTAQNFHMAVQTQGDSMVFLHKIEKGTSQQISYGIYAAESMGFPQSALECARELQAILSQRRNNNVNVAGSKSQQLHAVYTLGQKLIDLQASSLDDDSLRTMLFELKSAFFVTPSPKGTATSGGR